MDVMYLTDIPALCEQHVLRHQGVAIPVATIVVRKGVVVQSGLNEASAGVVWHGLWCGTGGGVVANDNPSGALDLIAPTGTHMFLSLACSMHCGFCTACGVLKAPMHAQVQHSKQNIDSSDLHFNQS